MTSGPWHTITEAEKLACAERELRMRRRNYPRWVAEGKMTQALAEHEIIAQEAIVEDYRKVVHGERLI